MEGRLTGSMRGPTSSGGDERALAVAGALFTFLLATKISLLLWHLLIKRSSPLADVPADGVLYLAGFDLLLCFGLAVVFYAIHRLEPARSRAAHIIGKIVRGAIVAGVVIFSVASFQVARIY